MKIIEFMKKKRKYLYALVALVIIMGGYLALNRKQIADPVNETPENAKTVGVLKVGTDSPESGSIEAVGVAKPDSKVEIVALAKGQVKNIYFEVGKMVSLNQILANLYDANTAANYATAKANYDNLTESLNNTKSISTLSVEQAQLGVHNAEEALKTAEIGLSTSENNLDNAKTLQAKANEDLKNNALIAYTNYTSTSHNLLDEINYIIKEEGSAQLAGISNVLGVKDSNSLSIAKDTYRKAKNEYLRLENISYPPNEAEQAIKNANKLMSLTKTALDALIVVWDNTISSSGFSETSLQAQKSKFSGLRASLIVTQSQAESLLQSLQNIDLRNKTELDGLNNALKISETQLTIARNSLLNAQTALNNARAGSSQQVLGSQISLDNARGQLNQASIQLANLTIKAPISGQITKKFVEVGTEINPGQPIAEISQLNLIKVNINLPLEDASKVKLGAKARLDGKYEATVTRIDPSADPITKKILVEITYDNKNKDITAESFLNVSIETEKLVKSDKGNFLIPLNSVTITQTASFVYIANDSSAKRQNVVLGDTIKNLVEVREGLAEGDLVITEGNKNLKQDDKLIIQ